nr:hypothetical protein [Plastoroseomonas arctica]
MPGGLQAPEKSGERRPSGDGLADRQPAQHRARRDVALGEAARREAGIGHARPHGAIGEGPAAGFRPQRGIGTRGVQHQIESWRGASGGVDQVRATIRGGIDAGDGAPRLDRRARGTEPRPQHPVQRRAVHGQGVQAGRKIGIGEVEHRGAAVGAAMQPVDPRTQCGDRPAQSDPLQRGEAGRLQHQARAQRPSLGEALEQGDVMAGRGEADARSQAGNAGADHGKGKASDHGRF